MGKQIIYVQSDFGTAAARYTFNESYNGINSFADFISTYAGIIFRTDATGARINNKCGVSFNAGKLDKYSIKLDAWYWVVNQLLTDINTSIGNGVAANSDAVFLLSLFTNFSYFKTESWSIFADAASYFSNLNFFIPCRFSPLMDLGDTMVVNGVVGNYGTTAIADGNNTITVSDLNSLNGNNVTVKINTINGSGNIVSLGTATAAISGGKFTSGAINISYTPGDEAIIVFDNVEGWGIADFGGNIFKANIGFGANVSGANAANMIDINNVAFSFSV